MKLRSGFSYYLDSVRTLFWHCNLYGSGPPQLMCDPTQPHFHCRNLWTKKYFKKRNRFRRKIGTNVFILKDDEISKYRILLAAANQSLSDKFLQLEYSLLDIYYSHDVLEMCRYRTFRAVELNW